MLGAAFAQNVFAQSSSAYNSPAASALRAPSRAKEPKLERFDPTLVDKALDPCNDFYKYACNKWLTANPIPPDQVFWSTGSGLATLERGHSPRDARSSQQERREPQPCPTEDRRLLGRVHGRERHRRRRSETASAGTRPDRRAEIKERHHSRSCSSAPSFPGAWQRQTIRAMLRSSASQASRIMTTHPWSSRKSIRAA